MNVAQLKERIFRGTQHKYTDQFHMVDLLNDALRMMTNDAKLEDITQISVINNVSNYAVPNNYKSPRSLVEGTLDNPTNIYQLMAIDEQGQGYAIWQNNLVLKPTPQESKTLNFYYYKWAAELINDEDVPDIDERYHSALTSYAIAMILPFIDAPQWLINQHFNNWNQSLSDFRSDIAKKNKQGSVRKSQTWR